MVNLDATVYVVGCVCFGLVAIYVISELADVLKRQKSTIAELREQLQTVYDVGRNEDCLFCGLKDRIAKKYSVEIIKKCGHCGHDVHSRICVTEWCKCGPWPQVEENMYDPNF